MTDRLELARDFDFSRDQDRSQLWETLMKLNLALSAVEARVDSVQAFDGDEQPDLRLPRYVAYPLAQNVEDVDVSSATGTVIPGTCGGRLSLNTEAVPTSDISSSSTLKLLPYLHDQVALYDGSDWAYYDIGSGVTYTLSGLASGSNYDVFLYDNSSTLTLELALWDSSTARTSFSLARQDGAWVKSGSTTRLYLGTLRTTGTTTSADKESQRFLWNHYNRVIRSSHTRDSSASHTENSASWNAAAAGDASYKHEYVIGLNEDPIVAEASRSFENPSNTTACYYQLSVGLDSSTAVAGGANTHAQMITGTPDWIGHDFTGKASFSDLVGIGYHYVQGIERSTTGTTTSGISNDGEDGMRSWSRM